MKKVIFEQAQNTISINDVKKGDIVGGKIQNTKGFFVLNSTENNFVTHSLVLMPEIKIEDLTEVYQFESLKELTDWLISE